jgi:LDH2 family malate/lactate/ureidoglycolate dehydrogenase
VDQAWLVREIEAITGYVTASPARNAEEPVLVPGDPERRMRAQRLVEGIPVDDVTWAQIAEAARGLGVDLTV